MSIFPPSLATERVTLSKLALPSVMIFLGIGLLLVSFWPLFSWTLWAKKNLLNSSLVLPVDERTFFAKLPPIRKPLPPPQKIKVRTNADGFSYFAPDEKVRENLGYFWLSVERLGIENALVNIASLDFRQALAHFPGSALPGETGNVFITGHSSHPSFFRLGDYQTIFTNLAKLEFGDKIRVFFGDQKLTYTVLGQKIVDPKEVEVLYPPDDWGQYLTLMSCIPPGINTQRLVILALLDENLSH